MRWTYITYCLRIVSGEIRQADAPDVFRYKYTTSARRCQANRRKNFFGGDWENWEFLEFWEKREN